MALGNLGQAIYNGSPQSPTVTTDPDYLAATAIWTGAPQTDAGSYPVTARVSDSRYTGTVTGVFTIAPADSAVTVTCPESVIYNGSAQTPCTAKASGDGMSDVPLTVSYSNNTNAGTATASASWDGDANHTGSSGSANFTIEKSAATVTLGSLTQTYTGSPQSPTVTTDPVGLNVTWTGAPQTDAGSYPVTVRISDSKYTGTATGVFTIAPAGSVVTVTCPTSGVTYTGSAQTPCTAKASGVGMSDVPLTVSYSNNINAGTATASASWDGDANHTGGNGNNTFKILYLPVGTMCLGSPGHQILQPINADGTSVFKQKSTVSAKFRVCDAYGNSVGTPGVVSTFNLFQTVSGTATIAVNEPVDSTSAFTEFRWSPADQEWIFNISTKNLSANKTYFYRIGLNDGTYIEFSFGLR